MAYGFVCFIEICRVALVDSLQNLGQRHCPGLYQQMDMTAHQDIGIEAIRVRLLISYKYFEVFGVVVETFEYLLSLIAPGYDVIECTFKFYPRVPLDAFVGLLKLL